MIIVEVMGRHAGWIATYSGLAGGAGVILVPERPFDIDEVCRLIRRRHSRGNTFSIVVVAEGATPADGDIVSEFGGATDAFGHVRLGGIAVALGEDRGAHRLRVAHDDPGPRAARRDPVAYDRVLGTRFGVAAINAANDGDFGKMVALRGTEIVRVPLDEALAAPKLLAPSCTRPPRCSSVARRSCSRMVLSQRSSTACSSTPWACC